jgi:formylglycine-generating enzyme required for sulfatase activity
MVRLILISMTIGLFFSGCAFVPPGTTQLEEKEQKIYMDKNPLTNLAWKEYIYWLKNKHGKNSGNYKKALPDSSVWTDAYPDSGFLSSSYDNKPIVGISLEQAKSYCEWRSKVVTKKFEKKVTYKLADFHSLKKVP